LFFKIKNPLSNNLHLVSFDVPFPANYGGVIDVFYKIKALHQLGVKIHLHAFEYGRGYQKELEKYCEIITYYKRSKSPLNILSTKPFIVKSRSDSRLIKNLKKDSYPILFEGLHTTYPLNDFDFKDRLILVRMHNIEHDYYTGLAQSEGKIGRRTFFKQEAKKLLQYERILQKANYILTISPFEQQYFRKKYGSKAIYIPVFNKNNYIKNISEKGEFAMYHGDLRVADNIKAVNFLLSVFKDLDYPLKIVSSYINNELGNKIKTTSNISFIKLDEVNKLDKLFEKAHVNVLPTFQKTGIKLKLIHALYQSRFCIVNTPMIEETNLENLCFIANTISEFQNQINRCFTLKYTNNEIEKRKEILKIFDNIINAKKIVHLIAKK
jgi:hypothetical protein